MTDLIKVFSLSSSAARQHEGPFSPTDSLQLKLGINP